MTNLNVFLRRLIKDLASFLFIQLPLQLVGILILLPVCYFYRIGELPKALRFFDSADPFIGRDTSVIDKLNTNPRSTPYFVYNDLITRYNWLAFRNPINYFGYKYLGYKFTGNEYYSIKGSLEVGDSTGRTEGLKIIELSTGPYEYLYVKKINPSSILGRCIGLFKDITKPSCFYFRMGHKIGDYKNPVGSYAQKVFTISYRSYSGL